MKGEGTAELTNQMITKTFPNINQLVGRSIYVSVSLLTESGKTQQILNICMHTVTCMCVIVCEKFIVCVFQAVKWWKQKREAFRL